MNANIVYIDFSKGKGLAKMKLNEKDRSVLFHLKEAKEGYWDLRGILDFYERLFQTLFAFKSQLKLSPLARFLEGKGLHLVPLDQGIPQVCFDDLKMDETPWMDLYSSVMEILIPYMGLSKDGIEVPRPDRILQYAREIFESRGSLIGSEDPPELSRAASGWTMAPFLQLAWESIMPKVNLSSWHQGFCPLCGGWPSLAALYRDSGRRLLHCPRCHGEWGFRRVGCPFCGGSDPQTYYPSEDGKYRLYLCPACKCYLKTVVLSESEEEVSFPVEALLTVPMDLAARAEGFRSG